MQDAVLIYTLRHAGDLFPADHYVIASADLSLDAHGRKRPADRTRKLLNAHAGRVAEIGDERVIQVAEIVVYSPSACGTAYDGNVMFPDKRRVYFLRRILVEADHDSVCVLPEHQPIALSPVFQDVFLKCKVETRVRASCLNIVHGHIHTAFLFSSVSAK